MIGREVAAAAATLRECSAALAARGSSILREAVGDGTVDAIAWRHYPDGEVYDPATHLQYFYHSHPRSTGGRVGAMPEHGHFHLFLHGEGMPPGMQPMLLPEIAVAKAAQPGRSVPQSAPAKRGRSDKVCHLVAIALDAGGAPVRLFTTNRWVTGETWYRGGDVIQMLDRVRLCGAGPALLGGWIGALVRLFKDDIAELLGERDKAIADWRWRRPRSNVFEDPRLEITSTRAIDLAARLAAADAGAATPALRQGMPLASLAADGWGS